MTNVMDDFFESVVFDQEDDDWKDDPDTEDDHDDDSLKLKVRANVNRKVKKQRGFSVGTLLGEKK